MLLRTPEGSSLAATAGIGERMAQELRKMPGVAHTLLTVGGTADKAVNNASIYVKLTDLDQRQMSQQQLMQNTRDMLATFPKEIHTGVEQVSAVGGNQSNAEIQYFIQGPDLQKLAKYSQALLAKMKTIPEPGGPDTTLRSGKPEVRLEIDRPRAADLGVSVLDIEQALNTLVAGQSLLLQRRRGPVRCLRPRPGRVPRQRRRPGASMTVPSSKIGSVGLDEVVHIGRAPGPRPSTASTASARSL